MGPIEVNGSYKALDSKSKEKTKFFIRQNGKRNNGKVRFRRRCVYNTFKGSVRSHKTKSLVRDDAFGVGIVGMPCTCEHKVRKTVFAKKMEIFL